MERPKTKSFTMRQHVRIFLSSPGDVAEERDLARTLINDILPVSPLIRGRFTFEVVSWDDPHAAPSLSAHLTPQEAINRQLPKPSECDIVIVVLWSRIGTPLPTDPGRNDGNFYRSGTEWEYENALSAARVDGKPEILIYRRTEKPQLDIDDPDFDEKRAQYQSVKDFFARFHHQDGSLTGSFCDYEAPNDFRELLRQQLESYIGQRLSANRAAGTRACHTGISPAEPAMDRKSRQLWRLPHSRNLQFVGRSDVLAGLHERLTSNEDTRRVQVISGLGGLGKTQTAIEFAYRHRDAFDLVWWIDAEEPTKLASDLVSLGRALELDASKANEEQIVVDAVRQWLSDNSGYLLIFDNVEGADDLRKYLPMEVRGAILITSRSPAWRGVGETVPLDVMTASDAQQLMASTGDHDAASTRLIAGELGYLPLAVAQASAYMDSTGCSIDTYRQLLEQHAEIVLADSRLPDGYPRSVMSAFQLSIEAAISIRPDAEHLLNLCAFLAPDSIPIELLVRSINVQEVDTPVAISLENAIVALRRYALVHRDSEGLSLHRLIQLAVRARLSAEEHATYAGEAVKLLFSDLEIDVWDIRRGPIITPLLPHAIAATNLADELDAEPLLTARLFNQIGLYLYQRANIREAEAYFRRSISIAESKLGTDHLAVTYGLNSMADLLRYRGDVELALEYCERAIAIRKCDLKPDDILLGQSFGNLGRIRRIQGCMEEARQYNEQALEILEKELGSDHYGIGNHLVNLAWVEFDCDKFDRAAEFFKRALSIFKKRLGDRHPHTASALEGLADVSAKLERPDESRRYLEQTLTIPEEALEPNHPHVANSLYKLALLDEFEGNRDVARSRLQYALSILDERLGRKHRHTEMVRHLFQNLFPDRSN